MQLNLPRLSGAVLGLDHVWLPRLALVRQRFAAPRVDDLAEAVAREFARADAAKRIGRGQRIAITVGSRGLANVTAITAAVVQEVRRLGAAPFIVPAMGTHGGATAEGQLAVLHKSGITEEAMACPIRSSLEVVEIGQLPSGCHVFCDRLAFEADGVIIVNRVKPHSALVDPLGSGLRKMLAVGLGKQAGAEALHRHGLQQNLPVAAQLALQRISVVFGLAVVENPLGETAVIEAVPPEGFEEADRRLLELARRYLPTIPFDPLDVLVVRCIGKDISGSGMDPNVVGLQRRLGGPSERAIGQIVALDLSEKSQGNAIGIGMADVVTERLIEKIDLHATYVNGVASGFLWGVRIPLALPTDREAILLACRGLDPEQARLVIVQDTAHLGKMLASEALLRETSTSGAIEVVGEPAALTFSQDSGELALEMSPL